MFIHYSVSVVYLNLVDDWNPPSRKKKKRKYCEMKTNKIRNDQNLKKNQPPQIFEYIRGKNLSSMYTVIYIFIYIYHVKIASTFCVFPNIFFLFLFSCWFWEILMCVFFFCQLLLWLNTAGECIFLVTYMINTHTHVHTCRR
jgi:hypothetical protein